MRRTVIVCRALMIFVTVLFALFQGAALLTGQTPSCPCTIWPTTAVPGTTDTNEIRPVELGVRFTANSNGFISGIRFYKGVNNTGTHIGHLWTNSGTLMATATFTGETASGWQQVNFSSPVAISANTVYVASYFSPTGDFSTNRSYFATTGVNNPPLSAPMDGGAGASNGVYIYGSTSQFPVNSYQSSNYWVDVVFSFPPPIQDTIWPTTAVPGTTDTNEIRPVELGVRFTANSNGFISGIRFYKGVNNTGTHIGHLWTNSGTLMATATFTGETASGWQQVNFSSPVAISANTVYVASYFSPTGDFSVNRSYFVTTGVNNPPLSAPMDGGAGASNGVYIYGSTSQFPVNSYQSSNYWVDVAYNSGAAGAPLAVTTTSPLPGGTQGIAYSQTLSASGGTKPYNWTLVTGSALPPGLTLSTGGIISGTPTGTATTSFTVQVTDSSSPAQTARTTLSITITSSSSSCPCTIWPSTATPTSADTNETRSLELGVRFTANTNGFISGIRFYKGVNNTGTHIGHLWTNSGTLMATATFTGEAASGWQQVNFSSPVAISANTVYVASYFSPTGDFSTNRSYFATTGVNNPPLSAPMDGGAGAANGVYTYGSTSQFPVNSYQSSNYWVDVVFSPGGNGAGPSVSISPKRGGVAVNQPFSVTATVTNDIGNAGVTWSVSAGGGLSLQTTTSASFKATTAGIYTVTATSKADGSSTASVTIGVTDLAGVTTYHNNLSRDGTNTQEYALTPANVTTSTFGKLFSCTIDSPAYAQPLWVPSLSIGGGVHNVVFVASSRDTVYAFDADRTPCVTYWSVSLLGSGETYVSSGDVSSTDIETDIGIVGTPVIDLSSSTLYVVSKSKDSGTSCTPSSSCHQRLHALNLVDRAEKFGAPYELTSSITVPGNGDGSSNGLVPFNTLRQNQRPGLALVNGNVYIAWASHGDNGPWHGWVIGFAANNVGAGPSGVWNSTPTAISGSSSDGGIWMSGGAPAADSSNNLYFLTGNGAFNADSGGSDYGDSTVKLSTTGSLHVTDYFTPSNQGSLNMYDQDHGSGGAAILVDQPSGPVHHLLIGGGKSGVLFLVNRDNMGHFNASANNVVQSVSLGKEIYATGAFWNNFFYIASTNAPLAQYAFDTGTGQFSTSGTRYSVCCYYFPGSTPSVSSLGSSTNGIVWALDNSQYCTTQSPGCGPTVLHAYDATNVSTEFWNSTKGSGNSAGNAVKFTVPTVANGKVYVPTRTELDVYGLLPN